jgi:integrase
MKHNLTDRYLQTVKAPAIGRLVVTDKTVRCLTIRISGVRSFVVRYRLPRQGQRDVTIGTYPEITLAEARQRARDIIAAAKRGIDIIAEERRVDAERRKEEATAQLVRDLVADYVRHIQPHLRRWHTIEGILNKHVVPVLGDRPAKSVRRADIVELLDAMQGRGLRQIVNRTKSALGALFTFALERQRVEDSPMIGVRPRPVETERSRVLRDAELRALWRALEEMPDPGRTFVKVLMLTAARRDEIRGMRWSEVDDQGVWLLPASRNKGGRDFELGLSRQVLDLLAGLPRVIAPGSMEAVFVFTINGVNPWSRHQWFKGELDARSGVVGWRWHDLRRTVRSRLSELRIPFEIAERAINHTVPKLERTYNRHSFFVEKKEAMQLWADRLAVIVGQGRDAPNVVELEIKRPAS